MNAPATPAGLCPAPAPVSGFANSEPDERGMCFLHDGQASIGRPDWMPCMYAMLLAAGAEGVELAQGMIARTVTGAQPAGWLENACLSAKHALAPLYALDEVRSTDTGLWAGAGYMNFTTEEVFDAFLGALKCYLITRETGKALAAGRKRAFLKQLVVDEHRYITEELWTASLCWARAWLKAGGALLSEGEQLVHVPGYQPLIGVAVQQP
ncbi:hypothetical protein [Aquipseudomonas alcaligenes]|uniref:hypothetical protein n=1 Tax=Aquipseudomonas alcaligenes TaxID=43263 RepID=UPI001F2A0529|nr:hypothetical protein [Pseudomonas alcaligenes]